MRPRRAVTTDSYSFILSPGGDAPLHVRFEPVGPEYVVGPEDHLRVSVRSPSADPVQIVSGDNWVTIWPAPAAEVSAVNRLGVELEFLV